jgi:hypothetical protein
MSGSRGSGGPGDARGPGREAWPDAARPADEAQPAHAAWPTDPAIPPAGAPPPAAAWQTGVTAHQGARQIPILCRHCGGPAAPAWDGAIHCSYCGHQDRLPPDELGRALELERRLAAAAEGALQLRGLEAALGHVFESRAAFLRAAGLWFFLALAVSAYALFSARDIIAAAPPAYRAGLLVNSLMGAIFVAGVGLAICLALLVGRLNYRRHVRRFLFARPPRHPGHPTRCRACDGDLPDHRDPFVTCPYCTTQNLVTPEIQRDRERLLASEIAYYRARAHGAVAATTRTSIHMSRTFTISVAAAYAAMIGAAYVAQTLLP